MAGQPAGIERVVLAVEPFDGSFLLRLGNLGFDVVRIFGRSVFPGGFGPDLLPGLVLILIQRPDGFAHQIQFVELHLGEFLHFPCCFHALRLQSALDVVPLLRKVMRGGVLQLLIAFLHALQIFLFAAVGQSTLPARLLEFVADGLVSVVVAGVPAICLLIRIADEFGCAVQLVVKQRLRGVLGDKAVLYGLRAAEDHYTILQLICHRLAEVIVVGPAIAIGLAVPLGRAADKPKVLQHPFGGVFGRFLHIALKRFGIGLQALEAVGSGAVMRLVVGVRFSHGLILFSGTVALRENAVPAILLRNVVHIAEQALVIARRFIHVEMVQLLRIHKLIQGVGRQVQGVEGNGKVGGKVRLFVEPLPILIRQLDVAGPGLGRFYIGFHLHIDRLRPGDLEVVFLAFFGGLIGRHQRVQILQHLGALPGLLHDDFAPAAAHVLRAEIVLYFLLNLVLCLFFTQLFSVDDFIPIHGDEGFPDKAFFVPPVLLPLRPRIVCLALARAIHAVRIVQAVEQYGYLDVLLTSLVFLLPRVVVVSGAEEALILPVILLSELLVIGQSFCFPDDKIGENAPHLGGSGFAAASGVLVKSRQVHRRVARTGIFFKDPIKLTVGDRRLVHICKIRGHIFLRKPFRVDDQIRIVLGYVLMQRVSIDHAQGFRHIFGVIVFPILRQRIPLLLRFRIVESVLFRTAQVLFVG